MQKRTLIAVASAALLLGGCSHNPPALPAAETPSTPEAMMANVTYSNNAVSPAELTVKAGTKVSFKNDSTSAIRLSRNPHPAHTGSTEFAGFDTALLDAGKTYDFTFAVKGTLTYHNHFNPGVMGKIVVE